MPMASAPRSLDGKNHESNPISRPARSCSKGLSFAELDDGGESDLWLYGDSEHLQRNFAQKRREPGLGNKASL